MAEIGTSSAWTSPAIPYLKSDQSDIQISENEASLIASLNSIGSILGSILCSLIVNRIGRKYTLILVGLSQLIGWTVLNLAKTAFSLYIAKFLMGISGASFVITPIYIGEISSIKNRGALLSLLSFSFYLGYVGMTFIGTFFSYHTMNKLGLIVPLISTILSLFLPETPYFHLMKNHDKEAEKILMNLQGTKDPGKVEEDLKRMKQGVLESQKVKSFALRELVATRGNRKAFTILIVMTSTRQLTGSGAIVAYMQEIFQKSGSIIKPEYSTLVFVITKLLAVISICRIIDLMGRRVTFLISGLFIALTLSTLGAYSFFQFHLKFDMTPVLWLPLATLMLYAFGFVIGFGTVPSVMGGEIFPVNVKGVALSTGQIWESMLNFMVTSGFYMINRTVKVYGTYWIFSAFGVIGSIFIFWYTPETKGKSLEEIQEILNGKKT